MLYIIKENLVFINNKYKKQFFVRITATILYI